MDVEVGIRVKVLYHRKYGKVFYTIILMIKDFQ
ncbi:hypothetical protein SDC9_212884 [bioreactor metagenome]|uniref:Uncharacterized protein n=1 Tax=bioreactor metagenome TaxID=1076179 RepID=A0A645JN75_9ZZZZ